MKPAQLRAFVKQGESEQLEFKTSTASLHTGMQTICAFLNSTSGGSVIFGVKDNGTIAGQLVTDKTRKELAQELRKIEPAAQIDIEYVRVAGERQVVVVSVQPGDQAPYTYDDRPFIRKQSVTMRMPKEQFVFLHNQNNQHLWESLPSGHTVTDLDKNRIKEIVRLAVAEKRLPESAISASIHDILKKLKLLNNNQLNNAAVILFCKKEDKQFMQSEVKLARFKGLDKSEFIDNKRF